MALRRDSASRRGPRAGLMSSCVQLHPSEQAFWDTSMLFAVCFRRSKGAPGQAHLSDQWWRAGVNLPRWPSRLALCGGGSLWSGEQRRPEVGARSAHPKLTRRNCLTKASEASGGSFSARPQAEQRNEVAAKRRPLQCETPSHNASRDAQNNRATSQRTSTTRRLQTTAAIRLNANTYLSRTCVSRTCRSARRSSSGPAGQRSRGRSRPGSWFGHRRWSTAGRGRAGCGCQRATRGS